MKKVYIYCAVIIVFVTGLLVYFYQQYFGLTIDAFESALNSFIINLIILVITVIVINLLFSHHHEKINKEIKQSDYIEILKEAHNSLVFRLKTYLITYVTKEMAKTSIENNEQKHIIELTDLKAQLDIYISKDFLTKGITITQAGEFDLFDFKEIELKHTDWLLDNNNKILASIHKYLMLYSNLMPNETLKLLVEIELIITRESAFMVPNIESFQNQLNSSILDSQSIKVISNQLVHMINKVIEFEKCVEKQTK